MSLRWVGDVTLWYQSVSFKHRAWMGLNQSELVKFTISYFVCGKLGEKRRIQREIPKSMGKIWV